MWIDGWNTGTKKHPKGVPGEGGHKVTPIEAQNDATDFFQILYFYKEIKALNSHIQNAKLVLAV